MKLLRMLERLWIAIAIISIGVGIYLTITATFDQAIWYFIVAFFALLQYISRRKQRLAKEILEGDK